MTTWTISNEILPAPLGDYETIMRRINETVFRRHLAGPRRSMQRADDLIVRSQLQELKTGRRRTLLH